MRLTRTMVALAVTLPFIGTALACDKDQTNAKNEQVKQQTASTQPATTGKTHATKPGG